MTIDASKIRDSIELLRAGRAISVSSIESEEEFCHELGPTGYQPQSAVDAIRYMRSIKKCNERNTNIQCKYCQFSDYDENIVSRHETKEHNILTWFPCIECRTTLTNQKLLDLHKTRFHYAGPFTCHACGQIFINLNDRQRHLEDHRFIGNHLCVVCGKTFILVEQLENHIENEIDERHVNFRSFVPEESDNMDTESINL